MFARRTRSSICPRLVSTRRSVAASNPQSSRRSRTDTPQIFLPAILVSSLFRPPDSQSSKFPPVPNFSSTRRARALSVAVFSKPKQPEQAPQRLETAESRQFQKLRRRCTHPSFRGGFRRSQSREQAPHYKRPPTSARLVALRISLSTASRTPDRKKCSPLRLAPQLSHLSANDKRHRSRNRRSPRRVTATLHRDR